MGLNFVLLGFDEPKVELLVEATVQGMEVCPANAESQSRPVGHGELPHQAVRKIVAVKVLGQVGDAVGLVLGKKGFDVR